MFSKKIQKWSLNIESTKLFPETRNRPSLQGTFKKLETLEMENLVHESLIKKETGNFQFGAKLEIESTKLFQQPAQLENRNICRAKVSKKLENWKLEIESTKLFKKLEKLETGNRPSLIDFLEKLAKLEAGNLGYESS